MQRTWSHLESIFIGSDDIRNQLPEDSKRFDGIDTDVKARLNSRWLLANFGIEEGIGAQCLKLKWLHNEPYHKEEHMRIDMSAKFDHSTPVSFLPCTFRGISSLTDVAHAPYIADILTPYQVKVYKICYMKIAILFDSNESTSFLRPFYEDVMIAFHEL